MLRRWVVGAALGRRPGGVAFEPHRPPYLADMPLAVGEAEPAFVQPYSTIHANEAAAPRKPLILALPGETVLLAPGDERSLFQREFSDMEARLAAYRFAWLPLMGRTIEPGWVQALWSTFVACFAQPDSSWAWHPYTLAERAINILDYARRSGFPGRPPEVVAQLTQHASAIAGRLEYFGDHNTSNHLSNNGRGLYRLGLALGLPGAIELGKRILLAEAQRIFGPSGMLREGSTHYHLLLTRNYADAFLAARVHARPEAGELAQIVSRGLAVLHHLTLPGGLPLIGDISPDCPPEFLACLLPGGNLASGWTALLAPDERAALEDLRKPLPLTRMEEVTLEGWARFTAGGWAALWHVAPEGWAPMPGHGHQDIGSFEAHWGRMPLIVDPGRGAYGETGDAAFYTSAAAHNGLMIDDHEPYPPNKPYYDSTFRHAICGAPPCIHRLPDGLTMAFEGYRRFPGIGRVQRSFRFDPQALTINDEIEGNGRRSIVRRLHSPWPMERAADGVLLRTPSGDFRIASEGELLVSQVRRWTAYGTPAAAWVVEIASRVDLPARFSMRVSHSS